MEKRIERSSVLWAAGFGLLAAFLLWSWFFGEQPLGLNVPLTVVLFYCAALGALRGRALSLRRGHNWLLLLLNGAFCATFALFNNGLLLFFNALAILTLTALQFCLMADLSIAPDFRSQAGDVLHYIFVRPFCRIGKAYQAAFAPRAEGRRRVLPGVLLGLAIAIPAIALLALLLSAADAVFAQLLQDLFDSASIGNVFLYLLLFAAIFTLGGSLLYSLAEGQRRTPASAAPAKERPRRSLIPYYVILGSVSAVLLVFSAVQLLYFFGGSTLPQGMTYAEYARSGFFQMFAAAAIVFSAVALILKLLPERNLAVKVLLTVMTVAVLIMLASTFQRLVLYEQAFRFTRLRLYVQAFTIMLFVVTVLVTVAVWRGRLPLGKPVFAVAMVFLLALSYFNVDGFIGRQNSQVFSGETIDLADEEQREALAYLLTLSEDAAPYYLTKLDAADLAYHPSDLHWNQTQTAAVRKVYHMGQEGDFRSWNLGRAQAAALLTPELSVNAEKTYEELNLRYMDGLLARWVCYSDGSFTPCS